MPTTLVVSDLHLGARTGVDALRRPGPLAVLTAAIEGADRVVLLGDLVELRQGPADERLADAAEALGALGRAIGPDRRLTFVPGNHDHGLLRPWFARRGLERGREPLGLAEEVPLVGPLLERLAALLEPARLEVVYPGTWVREDVWATHGHYLDRVMALPSFERLASGVMHRVTGPVPERGATPDDFEKGLSPIYAYIDAVAQVSRTPRRTDAGLRGWQLLSATGKRDLRTRAAQAAFPLAVRGLERAGFGRLSPDLSPGAVSRAGSLGMAAVVDALGVPAAHVLFGHIHRAGPLPGDPEGEWRSASGARLHNAGAWLDEALFRPGTPDSPYWGGRALLVEDDPRTPPRLVRLTADLGARPTEKG